MYKLFLNGRYQKRKVFRQSTRIIRGNYCAHQLLSFKYQILIYFTNRNDSRQENIYFFGLILINLNILLTV